LKLSRIEEIDLICCAFWLLFMGGFMTAILCTMRKVEENTRGHSHS
jgi:hypothetical protein